MSFQHPHLLWLLVPILIGLVLSFRWIHGMMRGRKILALAIRAILASLLVMALAGPESRRPNEGVCVMFVLDRSDSIGEADRAAQLRYLNEALKNLGDKDYAGVIVFGRDAQVEASPGPLRSLDRVLSAVDGSASDVAGALRLAAASFPDGKAKRIVLLSDGNETLGEAKEAAETAGLDDIAVDYYPLGQAPRGEETLVREVVTPSEARVGEPLAIRVQVEATVAGSGTLELDRNGVTVQRLPVKFSPGKNTYLVNDRLDRPGFHRYRAVLRTDRDRDIRNNEGAGFVAVRGKPRLLVLQSHARTELVSALRAQGLDVDFRDARSAPIAAEEIQRYDAVFLNDANAIDFSPGQMRLLQASVRDAGIGLAMVGGENSFLPGGWYATPVAEALPVDLNVRQRKSFPSTTILIISDTSGSMGMVEDGVPKVRLAAKAAEETVRLLSALDKVGVVASTDGIEFVAPIQPLSNKDAVISQIRRLSVGGGGIYMLPSMQFAQRELRKDNSKVRHLIMLADGADCDMQEGTLPIAMAMRNEKITTTAVAIGDGPHVPYLRSLAAAGGGRFYLAKRANQLPAIFTQDAAVMSRSAIEEGLFTPKVAFGEEAMRGLEGTPPLRAYCLTDSRPLARVGMRTHKDDPLLATWQYGLGASLAFTSDAQARWASAWVGWNGFGQFWAQAARSIMRRGAQTRYRVQVDPEAGNGRLKIIGEDADGNPVNTPPTQVRLTTPTGEAKEVPITQTGPGTFEGRFTAKDVGSYLVSVAEGEGETAAVSTSGFSVSYPLEYRSYRGNLAQLETLAQASGGQKVTEPRQAMRPATRVGVSIQDLWMVFVLAAAILLPFDVAVRRLALPVGEMLAHATAWIRRRPAPQPATAIARPETLAHAKVGTPRAPESQAPAATPTAPPKAPASAGSALLERRKRKQEEDSSV